MHQLQLGHHAHFNSSCSHFIYDHDIIHNVSENIPYIEWKMYYKFGAIANSWVPWLILSAYTYTICIPSVAFQLHSCPVCVRRVAGHTGGRFLPGAGLTMLYAWGWGVGRGTLWVGHGRERTLWILKYTWNRINVQWNRQCFHRAASDNAVQMHQGAVRNSTVNQEDTI